MDLTSFLIYCMIAAFTPGPTNIVILSTVNNYGANFKEFLQKHNKIVNVLMALFLAYAAIMIWM